MMMTEENQMRISRDEMYLRIAEIVALRGTCNRLRVGATIVNNNCIVAEGYNGAPSHQPHCIDVGCKINMEGHCIRTVHAELNAILKAAKYGHKVENGTMYCSHSPCNVCAAAIVNAGIRRLIYRRDFRDLFPLDFLRGAGVVVVKKEDPEETLYELLSL
jgi:dCMP deaminase